MLVFSLEVSLRLAGPEPLHGADRGDVHFGGPAGAVSSRATQSYVNGNAGDGFAQGWSYDQLGNVTTVTYPRCASADCNGAATTSRMVGFTYANGWQASVPGYASAIRYCYRTRICFASTAPGAQQILPGAGTYRIQ
jgi:hypothetical protein